MVSKKDWIYLWQLLSKKDWYICDKCYPSQMCFVYVGIIILWYIGGLNN
jgi:hypothetical protein